MYLVIERNDGGLKDQIKADLDRSKVLVRPPFLAYVFGQLSDFTKISLNPLPQLWHLDAEFRPFV